jgi:hypothetical protein
MDARGVIMPFLSNFFLFGGTKGGTGGEGVTVSCGRCKQVKKVYRSMCPPTKSLLLTEQ